MKKKLELLRKEIDKIDQEIFSLLEKRFKIVKKIGSAKRKDKLAVRDKKREKEIVKNKTDKFQLSKKLISDVYQAIFDYAYKIQKK